MDDFEKTNAKGALPFANLETHVTLSQYRPTNSEWSC